MFLSVVCIPASKAKVIAKIKTIIENPGWIYKYLIILHHYWLLSASSSTPRQINTGCRSGSYVNQVKNAGREGSLNKSCGERKKKISFRMPYCLSQPVGNRQAYSMFTSGLNYDFCMVAFGIIVFACLVFWQLEPYLFNLLKSLIYYHL